MWQQSDMNSFNMCCFHVNAQLYHAHTQPWQCFNQTPHLNIELHIQQVADRSLCLTKLTELFCWTSNWVNWQLANKPNSASQGQTSTPLQTLRLPLQFNLPSSLPEHSFDSFVYCMSAPCYKCKWPTVRATQDTAHHTHTPFSDLNWKTLSAETSSQLQFPPGLSTEDTNIRWVSKAPGQPQCPYTLWHNVSIRFD